MRHTAPCRRLVEAFRPVHPLERQLSFFDPCAFQLQPVGTLGNVGRNILRGPGFNNLDFALQKDTKLGFLGRGRESEIPLRVFQYFQPSKFRYAKLSYICGDTDRSCHGSSYFECWADYRYGWNVPGD